MVTAVMHVLGVNGHGCRGGVGRRRMLLVTGATGQRQERKCGEAGKDHRSGAKEYLCHFDAVILRREDLPAYGVYTP